MRTQRIRRVIPLAVLFTAGGTTLLAQLQTGRVVGTVFDEHHAGIPGATITVIDLATNIARSDATHAEGHYVVTPLDRGTCSVRGAPSGFQTAEADRVDLAVGQAARGGLVLAISALPADA